MSLSKAFLTVSGLTFISRVTGLLREIFIASAFGVSPLTDAFNIAFRIPNSLRRLSAEGAFSQAFVPILAEFKNSKGKQATRALINAMANILFCFLVFLSLLGIFFSSSIINLVAPGLAKGNVIIFDAAVWMTRIMFPYIILISLVSFVSIILNTYQHFALPAITPIVLNLSLMGSILFLAPYLSVPIYALAIAVIFGGIIQLLMQLPQLYRLGLMPSLNCCLISAVRYEGVKRVFLKMLPATFSVSVSQISVLMNTNIASKLVSGSISWLSYADRLMDLPAAVLGVALGTILLPDLALAYTSSNKQRYSALLDWGLRVAFLIAIPATLALIFLPLPITATLFHYGRFSEFDVMRVAQTLIPYGIGLISLVLVKILAPGFYASQNIKTPVKIALLVAFCTQLGNMILVPIFAHLALAISISIGAVLNASLLFLGLKRRRLYLPSKGWMQFLFKIILAGLVSALVMISFDSYLNWIELASTPVRRVALLFIALSSAFCVYCGMLFTLGFRYKDFRCPD